VPITASGRREAHHRRWRCDPRRGYQREGGIFWRPWLASCRARSSYQSISVAGRNIQRPAGRLGPQSAVPDEPFCRGFQWIAGKGFCRFRPQHWPATMARNKFATAMIRM
jgi:hypothetical protein